MLSSAHTPQPDFQAEPRVGLLVMPCHVLTAPWTFESGVPHKRRFFLGRRGAGGYPSAWYAAEQVKGALEGLGWERLLFSVRLLTQALAGM